MTAAAYISIAFGLFGVLTVVVAAIYTGRVKGQQDGTQNVIQLLKDELDAVRLRANRFHDDLREERKERQGLEAKLVKLEALPDMTGLLEEMKAQREWGERRTVESMQAVTNMFARHEERAMERHTLIVESFGHLNEGLTSINESLRHLNDGAK